MQCNIDARGKAVRLLAGTLFTGGGLVALVLWQMSILPDWFWMVGTAATVCGLVMIAEARAGWCILRAMGLRTPV